jgi:ATP synthase protein I
MLSKEDQVRLDALDQRIAAAKAAHSPIRKESPDSHRQAQLAWRMVIELVSGLMIGFGIGYGLDTVLGTMPIFLVLFIFVGLAAGVKTMLISAKEMQARAMAADDPKAAQVADEKEEN